MRCYNSNYNNKKNVNYNILLTFKINYICYKSKIKKIQPKLNKKNKLFYLLNKNLNKNNNQSTYSRKNSNKYPKN